MNRRGMLLAAISNLCYVPDFAPFSLCSIEGEGDDGAGDGGDASRGGGGGAAGLLEDDGGGGEAKPGEAKPGEAKPGEAAKPGEEKGGKAEPPAWAAGLSLEAGEGETSNRDYIAAKGYQDPDALVKAYREAEKALHGGKGYVKVPGEGAKPEELAAFRTAMGVPETAEAYVINLPEAGDGPVKLEIDTAFADPLKKAAFEAGVPAAAFGKMADTFVKMQLDHRAELLRVGDQEADAKVKEWGAGADAKKADYRKGAQLLGLDRAAIYALQHATMPDGSRFGGGRLLDMISGIGSLAGEDHFAGGGGKANFGVASGAEAQASITEMGNDPAVAKQMLIKGTPENARYERLLSAVAHYKEVESRGR